MTLAGERTRTGVGSPLCADEAVARLNPAWLATALILAVPVALGILVHRRYLGVWFWTDDFVWLQAAANPDFSDWAREALTFPQGATPYWRPLVDAYFFAMYRVFGLHALAYHIANLALHISTGALLGLLGLRLTRSTSAAALAAGLFVISPTYGALVAWPAGATALLSAFFSIATVLLFIVWLQDNRSCRWLALSAATFALALLTKEEAAALPAVLALCALFVRQPRSWREMRNAGLPLLPFLGVWIAYIVPQLGGPGYAIPVLMQLRHPGTVVYQITREDLIEASLPSSAACTLYWTESSGYQAKPVPPTDGSLRFLVPS